MDTVRKLILERLTDLGLKRKEVSLAIGRNDTYLSQFLRRGVPEELPERERLRLADILKVQEATLRGPSVSLIKHDHEKENGSANKPNRNLIERAKLSPYNPPPGTELIGSFDLPLHKTAKGGENGALIVSVYAVDYVARPPMVARVEEAYGLIVGDDTMSPEHKIGSIAVVNPNLPPKVGDSCVYRCRGEGGTLYALIRTFRGETETHWLVSQHKPEAKATLKKSDWATCQKTVANYFA